MKLLVYFFLAVFVVSIFYSFVSKWARVDEIVFSTQGSWLKEKEKNQLLVELKKQTHPLLGSWIWQVSIRKLNQMVKDHPKVEEVQVIRSWPNRFRVLLLSDEPLLILMGNKVFYPITEKGVMLNALASSSIPDLPILRGDIFFGKLELRKKAVQLFQYLPKEGLFSQSNISEIKYSTKDSNFYLYLLHSGTAVRVGESLSEFRPDRVENVLRYLEQKKINWRVIDARYSQKVVVSLVKGI